MWQRSSRLVVFFRIPAKGGIRHVLPLSTFGGRARGELRETIPARRTPIPALPVNREGENPGGTDALPLRLCFSMVVYGGIQGSRARCWRHPIPTGGMPVPVRQAGWGASGGEPLTGEPCARNAHARSGARGAGYPTCSPFPYHLSPPLFRQIPPCTRNHHAAMFHPFCCQNPVGQVLDFRSGSANNNDFQAIVMVQMNMQ